jgi:ribosomal-protein-alanine N-acetyltransferase
MKSELPLITTNHLLLRVAIPEDIPQIIQYFTFNKAYLTKFSPTSGDGFFTAEYWQYQIEKYRLELIHGYVLRLFIYHQINHTKILGVVNFSSFVRGGASFCNVGYSLAETAQSHGYMTEALKPSTE